MRILSVNIEQEVNISQLAELVGVTKPALSHHMRGQRQMHLVKARSEGREVYYLVDDPHIIALYQQGVKHVIE